METPKPNDQAGERTPKVESEAADRPVPFVRDHELLTRIGHGSYGDVFLARNIMGTFRAVKVVYRNRFEQAKPYEREYRGIEKFEPVSRTHERR